MSYVVGIDLGTTHSAIAFVNGWGKPEIIHNEFGRSITPSVIYFEEGRHIVGDKAKEQQRMGKKEVVQLFKRNMDDENFLFSIHGHDYTPTDLSALVLSYMKDQAERHLKGPVTDAVITVPAYFTDPQRKATIKAGEQAGLRVLAILDEPTAAALAYDLLSAQEEQRILVYDLGGGTFDVSLISITTSTFRVIATDGNNWLGGANWDERLLKHLIDQCKHTGIELKDDEIERLYYHVEQAKHALSVRQRAEISFQVQARTITHTITRSLFEELTRDLMEETHMITERLLRSVGVTWESLSGVLLVGGATRMPMVRSYIERMSGKPPISNFNPDEVVAFGAAIQAVREFEQISDAHESHGTSASRDMVGAIAHSLGMIVESNDRSQYINSILIQKNSPIPAFETRSYQMRLHHGGKTQLEVFLTQGESANPQHCVYLGRYLFSDFPALSSRTTIIDITYQYNKNGTVNVSARERSSGLPLTLSVESRPLNVPGRFADRPKDRVRKEPLTLYLALDLSGSMQGEPFEQAKQAVLTFVETCNLTNTSIGLVSFSDKVVINLVASQDMKAIRQAIEELSPGQTGYGNNSHPFDELYTLLSHCAGLRYAVVLTDGSWSRPELAIQQAQRCHDAGIEVFALGFGAAKPDFLSIIASSTEQGLHIELSQLTEAFGTIAQELAEDNLFSIHSDQQKESEIGEISQKILEENRN
jgi:molecular chaperone DnaK (HSP70)